MIHNANMIYIYNFLKFRMHRLYCYQLHVAHMINESPHIKRKSNFAKQLVKRLPQSLHIL